MFSLKSGRQNRIMILGVAAISALVACGKATPIGPRSTTSSAAGTTGANKKAKQPQPDLPVEVVTTDDTGKVIVKAGDVVSTPSGSSSQVLEKTAQYDDIVKFLRAPFSGCTECFMGGSSPATVIPENYYYWDSVSKTTRQVFEVTRDKDDLVTHVGSDHGYGITKLRDWHFTWSWLSVVGIKTEDLHEKVRTMALELSKHHTQASFEAVLDLYKFGLVPTDLDGKTGGLGLSPKDSFELAQKMVPNANADLSRPSRLIHLWGVILKGRSVGKVWKNSSIEDMRKYAIERSAEIDAGTLTQDQVAKEFLEKN